MVGLGALRLFFFVFPIGGVLVVLIALAVDFEIKPTVPFVFAVDGVVVGIGNLLGTGNEVGVGVDLFHFGVSNHGNSEVFHVVVVGATAVGHGGCGHPALVSGIVGVEVVELVVIYFCSVFNQGNVSNGRSRPKLGAHKSPVSGAFESDLHLGGIADELDADTSSVHVAAMAR
jgi:hypothetical protein